MTPVRNLFSDLVERRLWPIALLLVLALVAVPVLLAKSPPAAHAPADGGAAAAAASASAAATDDTTVVTLASGDAAQPAPTGHAKNPFRQQRKDKNEVATGASNPVSDGSGSGGATGSSGSGGSTGDQTGPKIYQLATVDVQFGKATIPLHTHDDVPRLTPLPRAANPIVVFLGMRKDLKTAVFMISSDVHAQGDGTCTPSRKECTAIELKEGDVAFLDVTDDTGRVVQYELDLVRVAVHQTTSQAEAQQAYARVSRVGARLMRHRTKEAAQATGHPFRIPYRYAERRGVLHIAPFLSRRLAQRSRTAGHTGALHAVVAP